MNEVIKKCEDAQINITATTANFYAVDVVDALMQIVDVSKDPYDRLVTIDHSHYLSEPTKKVLCEIAIAFRVPKNLARHHAFKNDMFLQLKSLCKVQ